MAENEESRVLAFSVKVLESGIIFFPSNAKLFQDGPSGEYERPVIRCENVGSDAKSFIITADGPDLFNPFLSGADLRWNYSTHSTIITMSGWENRTYTFNPNLIAYSDSYVGEYDIFLNATSLSDPDIISSFRLHFTIGIKMRLFSLNEHELFIPPGENRSVEISLSNVSGRVLDLKLKGLPAGFVAQLYDSESNLISGNSHWALKRGQNASLDYLLVITAQANGTYGQQFSMRLTLHDPGTQPSFGIYPFIIGSFSVVALTLVMAAPLGIGCAIFFSEFSPPRIRKLLLPVFELLAGIPSVVYGMWGFLVFGPFLAKTVFPFFGRQSIWGESILTASIVLTIMVLPIIVTLSYDAMRNVKKELREGSYAVGVTKWGTAIRVVLPTAKSGIASSVILAMGRAIGETMAVVMIMGPVTTVPHSLLDPAGTMPSIIAGVLGWGFSDDYIRQALFAIASILFLIIFVLNSIVFRLQGEQKTGGSSAFRRIRKKIGQLFRSREGVGIPVVTARDNIGTRKIKQVGNHNNVLDDIRRMFKPSKSAIRGQKMAVGVLVGCVIFVIIMLSMILQDVLFVGITSFRIDFLVNKESTLTSATGGFLNAIIGSLLLVGIALALAVPLSLGAAIYINEYIKKGDRMSRTVLFASDTLASTPSIVFGAFGFLFFVLYFRLGFSLLAGGLTLGFMIIPLLLRSSLESLKSVPNDYREASHSLGASQWQTIRNAVLPPAMPMITSGIIIGIGRAIGETAAVIFTAGYTAHVVDSLLLPAASMPNMIYLYFSFSAIYPVLKAKVYSCALVLLLMVLSLNITARYIQSRTTKGKGTL
jgi:phosphate transport system permease protein